MFIVIVHIWHKNVSSTTLCVDYLPIAVSTIKKNTWILVDWLMIFFQTSSTGIVTLGYKFTSVTVSSLGERKVRHRTVPYRQFLDGSWWLLRRNDYFISLRTLVRTRSAFECIRLCVEVCAFTECSECWEFVSKNWQVIGIFCFNRRNGKDINLINSK